jgi:hypothetical protein
MSKTDWWEKACTKPITQTVMNQDKCEEGKILDMRFKKYFGGNFNEL